MVQNETQEKAHSKIGMKLLQVTCSNGTGFPILPTQKEKI